MIFRGLLGFLFLMTVGCGEGFEGAPVGADDVASATQELTGTAQAELTWANAWVSEVKAEPSRLAENEYTSSATELERMRSGVMATNRNVCGTLVTQVIQKSIGYDSSDFYHSFNKAMDSCETGTVNGEQKGTSSPNASQYRWKIANCGGTGPIQFTRRDTIGAVRTGDVLAVTYPDRTDITGHVMIVRKTPVVDRTLPAGPSGSTPYAVEILDSTSTPHGSASRYPDWRGGNRGRGFGYGTFVLYADGDGKIVASRWSATDSTLDRTSTNKLAIGGLR